MASTVSLSIKLIRIGAGLLVIALASIGLTLWVTWQLEGGAAAVNEAGRMRMQTWRLNSAVAAQLPASEVQALVSQGCEAGVRLVYAYPSDQPAYAAVGALAGAGACGMLFLVGAALQPPWVASAASGALLVNLSLVIAGLAAWSKIPVAARPSYNTPIINVGASLPGASPETMATSTCVLAFAAGSAGMKVWPRPPGISLPCSSSASTAMCPALTR